MNVARLAGLPESVLAAAAARAASLEAACGEGDGADGHNSGLADDEAQALMLAAAALDGGGDLAAAWRAARAACAAMRA